MRQQLGNAINRMGHDPRRLPGAPLTFTTPVSQQVTPASLSKQVVF
jgi:hypothetical protein